jgi:hypothetical protein
MNLLLNISEIAIITGDNPYKTKRDYLLDFWKKNANDDYIKYQQLTKYTKITDDDIIKKISLNNKIDLSLELKKCNKTNNISDLDTMKNEIFKKIENLNENEKDEITKSIKNVTNTKFGIRNENDVTKLYENITGNSIIKDNKYHKKKLFEMDDINVYIGGKIDGINENGSIIEVKNRVNKLFYELRSYEKVQIMCYLHLFNAKEGHLVEALKKNNTSINIIKVDYDKEYIDYIIDKIRVFAIFFKDFINNHDMKINIMQNNIEIDF